MKAKKSMALSLHFPLISLGEPRTRDTLWCPGPDTFAVTRQGTNPQ